MENDIRIEILCHFLFLYRKKLVQSTDIAIISKIQHEKFNLIFAEGTTLSKAHRLIYRMSEGIDFKSNVKLDYRAT